MQYLPTTVTLNDEEDSSDCKIFCIDENIAAFEMQTE